MFRIWGHIAIRFERSDREMDDDDRSDEKKRHVRKRELQKKKAWRVSSCLGESHVRAIIALSKPDLHQEGMDHMRKASLRLRAGENIAGTAMGRSERRTIIYPILHEQ